MTSPPKQITVQCPECSQVYRDWHRASINLTMDDFDDDYIRQCSTSTCPHCGYTVEHDVLIVNPDGVWEIDPSAADVT